MCQTYSIKFTTHCLQKKLTAATYATLFDKQQDVCAVHFHTDRAAHITSIDGTNAKHKEPAKSKEAQRNVSTNTSKPDEERHTANEETDKRQIYSIGDGGEERMEEKKHVEMEREAPQEKIDDNLDVDGNRKVEGYSSEEEDLDGARSKTVALDKRPDDKKLPSNVQKSRNQHPAPYLSSSSSSSSSSPVPNTNIVSMEQKPIIIAPRATIPVISVKTPAQQTRDEDGRTSPVYQTKDDDGRTSPVYQTRDDERKPPGYQTRDDERKPPGYQTRDDVIEEKTESDTTVSEKTDNKPSPKTEDVSHVFVSNNIDADFESSESSESSSESDSESASETERSLDREVQRAEMDKPDEKSPPSSLPDRPQSPVALALMEEDKDGGMTQEAEMTNTGRFLFEGPPDEDVDKEDKVDGSEQQVVQKQDVQKIAAAEPQVQQDRNDMNKMPDKVKDQESAQTSTQETSGDSSSGSSSSGSGSSSEGSSSGESSSGSDTERSQRKKTQMAAPVAITPDVLVVQKEDGGGADDRDDGGAQKSEVIHKDAEDVEEKGETESNLLAVTHEPQIGMPIAYLGSNYVDDSHPTPESTQDDSHPTPESTQEEELQTGLTRKDDTAPSSPPQYVSETDGKELEAAKDEISPPSSPPQSTAPVIMVDETEQNKLETAGLTTNYDTSPLIAPQPTDDGLQEKGDDRVVQQKAEVVDTGRSEEVLQSSDVSDSEDSSEDSSSDSQSHSDHSSVRKKRTVAVTPEAAIISQVPNEISDDIEETSDIKKDEFDVTKEEIDVKKDEFDVTKEEINVKKDEFDVTNEEIDVKKDEFDVTNEEIDVKKDEFDVTNEEIDLKKDEFDVTNEEIDLKKDEFDVTKEETENTEEKTQNVEVMDENKMATAVVLAVASDRIMESPDNDNRDKAISEHSKPKSVAVEEQNVNSPVEEEQKVNSSGEEEQKVTSLKEEEQKVNSPVEDDQKVISPVVEDEKDKVTAGDVKKPETSRDSDSDIGSSDSSSDSESDSDESQSEGEFQVVHTPDSNTNEKRKDAAADKQNEEKTQETVTGTEEPQRETTLENGNVEEATQEQKQVESEEKVETTVPGQEDEVKTAEEQVNDNETLEEPSEPKSHMSDVSDPEYMNGGNDPEHVASEVPVTVISTLPPRPPRTQHSGSVMPLLEVQDEGGLELKNMELTKTQWFEVSKFLKTNDNLKTITLSNMGMEDSDFDMVYEALLKSQSNPVILNFNMNSLRAQSTDNIADLLKEKTSVDVLLLQGNPIGDTGVRSLVDGLLDIQFDEQQWRKSEIAKQQSEISELETPVLRKLVGNFCHLRELDLSDTDMTDEGTTDIALLLEHNTDLQTLSLQGNKYITRWTKIGKSLSKNRKLETLTIDHNMVGDEGIEALAEGLKDNSSVRTIDLVDTGIREKGGAMLIELLKKNTTLQELTLTPGNSIPQLMLDDIKRYLNLNQSINV